MVIEPCGCGKSTINVLGEPRNIWFESCRRFSGHAKKGRGGEGEGRGMRMNGRRGKKRSTEGEKWEEDANPGRGGPDSSTGRQRIEPHADAVLLGCLVVESRFLEERVEMMRRLTGKMVFPILVAAQAEL